MAATMMDLRSFLLMVMVAIIIGLLATGAKAENHLLSGDKLRSGENISDANYSLRMQPDCNLVLYELTNLGKPVWLSYTNGKGIGCELTLQNDGNLVIHDDKQKLLWETKTNGTVGNYALVLQRDRDLAIYSASVWSAGINIA